MQRLVAYIISSFLSNYFNKLADQISKWLFLIDRNCSEMSKASAKDLTGKSFILVSSGGKASDGAAVWASLAFIFSRTSREPVSAQKNDCQVDLAVISRTRFVKVFLGFLA